MKMYAKQRGGTISCMRWMPSKNVVRDLTSHLKGKSKYELMNELHKVLKFPEITLCSRKKDDHHVFASHFDILAHCEFRLLIASTYSKSALCVCAHSTYTCHIHSKINKNLFTGFSSWTCTHDIHSPARCIVAVLLQAMISCFHWLQCYRFGAYFFFVCSPEKWLSA